MDRRVSFDGLEWSSPMAGVRHRVSDEGGTRLRYVEYSDAMEPHWCDRGHIGIILEGRMKIEFPDGTEVFEKGDGVLIPPGQEHRHRATALTPTVTALFVEDI